MSEELLNAAEKAAMETLSARHRLMVQIIPEGRSDEFCKRLASWANLILDLGMLPPLPVVARRKGDGLICPYCGITVRADFRHQIDRHKEDCDWRKAMIRWAYTNLEIDKELKARG